MSKIFLNLLEGRLKGNTEYNDSTIITNVDLETMKRLQGIIRSTTNERMLNSIVDFEKEELEKLRRLLQQIPNSSSAIEVFKEYTAALILRDMYKGTFDKRIKVFGITPDDVERSIETLTCEDAVRYYRTERNSRTPSIGHVEEYARILVQCNKDLILHFFVENVEDIRLQQVINSYLGLKYPSIKRVYTDKASLLTDTDIQGVGRVKAMHLYEGIIQREDHICL